MKKLDLQFRFDSSAPEGEIRGIASPFGEVNSFNERVAPGAFERTISEHRSSGTAPLMLWAHDQSEPIGVWKSLEETSQGLEVRGTIVTETRRGAEAYALLKAGALNGLSIGFRARKQNRDKSGVRVLTDVDLAEISVVGLPSAASARISEIRNTGRNNGRAAAFVKSLKGAASSIKKGI